MNIAFMVLYNVVLICVLSEGQDELSKPRERRFQPASLSVLEPFTDGNEHGIIDSQYECEKLPWSLPENLK